MILEFEQAEKLFHSRKNGHFLGYVFLVALGSEKLLEVRLDLSPVDLQFTVDADLLGEQVPCNLDRLFSNMYSQGIGQAVGGIRTHDDCSVPKRGAGQGGRRGQGGFAHSALARVKDNAQFFLRIGMSS